MNRKKLVTSALIAFMMAAPLSGKAFAELRWMPMESVVNPTTSVQNGVDPLVLNELIQKMGSASSQQDGVLTALLKQQTDMSVLLANMAQQQQATAQANFLLAFMAMTPAQQQSILSLLSMSPEKLKGALAPNKQPEKALPPVVAPKPPVQENAAPAVIRMENTAEAVLERLQKRSILPETEIDPTPVKKNREKDKKEQKNLPAVATETPPPVAPTPVVNSFTHTFSLYCKPGVLSQVRLQPGEEIQYIGGGDLSNWFIDKVASTSDGLRQWNLYIKPLIAGISTNIIITTDQNTYQLLAKTETPGSINRKSSSAETLNYGYKIEGESGEWTIYDDGIRTYIKMPSSLSRTTPEFFVLDARNALIKTEYKQFKGVMIIDRLFDEALINLGKKTVSFRRGL